MTKLRCKILGHKPTPPGWWGDIPYGHLEGMAPDNVGRIHAEVRQECCRCGEFYLVARLHLNHPHIVRALNLHPALFRLAK